MSRVLKYCADQEADFRVLIKPGGVRTVVIPLADVSPLPGLDVAREDMEGYMHVTPSPDATEVTLLANGWVNRLILNDERFLAAFRDKHRTVRLA
jgi:hypothetical protein